MVEKCKSEAEFTVVISSKSCQYLVDRFLIGNIRGFQSRDCPLPASGTRKKAWKTSTALLSLFIIVTMRHFVLRLWLNLYINGNNKAASGNFCFLIIN